MKPPATCGIATLTTLMNHKLITNQTSLKQTSLAQGLAICMLTRSLGTNFPAPVLHHPQGTNVGRRALDRVSHHLGAPRLQAPSRSRRATFTNGHIIYGPLKLPFCRKNAPIESAKEEVDTCSPGSYALFLFASPPTCLFPSPTCHPARCKLKQVVAICGVEHWIHVAHETPCMSFPLYNDCASKIYLHAQILRNRVPQWGCCTTELEKTVCKS